MNPTQLLQEFIRLLNNLNPDSQAVQGTKAAMGSIRSSIQRSSAAAEDAANTFTRAFATLAEGATSSADPIERLRRSYNLFSKDLDEAGKGVDTFLSLIPGIGTNLGQAFKMGTEAVKGSIGAIIDLNEGASRVTSALDQMSRPIREIRSDFANLGITMGMSYEETKKFSDEFAKMFGRGRPDLFVSAPEVRRVTEELAAQSVAYEELNESINTNIGSMMKQEAIIMLARTTGEDFSTTTQTITDGMMKLGMSFEASAEQYGMIRSVAKETGLQFNDIKSALDGAVTSFERLGMSMGFARPVFEGFVNSLKGVGLGIKQATALTQAFVSSLGGIAQNYEKAFIVAQRGNIPGMQGGGVFQAGIEMRGRMLDAKESGEQGAVGLEMAKGMKEALASFTGGEIITLQEARQSPELANQYVMQENILKDMFGIQGANAERTLELLKDIDNATVQGDEELKGELGSLLEEQTEKQDKTFDEAEKTNRHLQNMISQLTVGNTLAQIMADRTKDTSSALGESQRDILNMTRNMTTNMLNKGGDSEAMQAASEEMKDKLKTQMDDYNAKTAKLAEAMGVPENKEGPDARNAPSGTATTGKKDDSQKVVVEISFSGEAAGLLKALEKYSGKVVQK